MNAPFSAVFRTLNGTAASLSSLHETLRRMEAETRTALRLNDQNRERRVCTSTIHLKAMPKTCFPPPRLR